MTLIIQSMSMVLNISFSQLNHPMSMVIIILIQTLLVCLMSGTLMESFWLSYILFLTFLGGMLVLFIYITSIASNEMFHIKSLSLISLSIMLLIISSAFLIIKMIWMSSPSINSEMEIMNDMMMYFEMSDSLKKLYNAPTYVITLMMMMYLFLALVAVAKITNINQGPIRKMN
uniref:NADH-ubiquinone oxidoreductase chain 6 n=1 Tax=Tanaocerus koebelei TaxID=1260746 RepID=M4JDU9_9ORTH|nr:NADH dehydrogenase subunit 6 [Tanaocerus koebelei]AGC22383.1 NADH dehydrogenase subunit 6 [Tanaocerus koebelei]